MKTRSSTNDLFGMRFVSVAACAFACLLFVSTTYSQSPKEPADREFALIVMDPLAAPLSCPCVEGYAQRRYEVLAKHLCEFLGQKVAVTYAESLQVGLQKSGGHADLLIGKRSVVLADARKTKSRLTPVAMLTDQTGSSTQNGLIVVAKDDPAKSTADLASYTIIFGPSEAAEKHEAAITLLEKFGVAVPEKQRLIDQACSDGACKVIDLGPKSKTAAVISSYAQPLLEGCGTIQKGDLRVVGKTKPVPFITAFVDRNLAEEKQTQICSALEDVVSNTEVLEALESLIGFQSIDPSTGSEKEASKKKRRLTSK